jgi:hypothetical protein
LSVGTSMQVLQPSSFPEAVVNHRSTAKAALGSVGPCSTPLSVVSVTTFPRSSRKYG